MSACKSKRVARHELIDGHPTDRISSARGTARGVIRHRERGAQDKTTRNQRAVVAAEEDVAAAVVVSRELSPRSAKLLRATSFVRSHHLTDQNPPGHEAQYPRTLPSIAAMTATLCAVSSLLSLASHVAIERDALSSVEPRAGPWLIGIVDDKAHGRLRFWPSLSREGRR